MFPHIHGPPRPRVVKGHASSAPRTVAPARGAGGASDPQRHQDRRLEHYRQATECFVRGDLAGAERHARAARREESLMQEAHQDAARSIMSGAGPASRVVSEVDLHGRFTADAVNCAMETLAGAKKQIPRTRESGVRYVVRVVTGRGAHSQGNVARIKPAVIRYLEQSRMVFADNGGELLVEI
jgi:NEDD4-binding protein 2